ncbi:MAG TPA: hypothetical protein VJS86_18435 [Arthrobacter sp.]|nr:hypothetical protein [Arthrobacter sp.]
MPSVSGLDAEAAYDIWLNDLNKEVMVWVDNHGQTPAGSKVAIYSVSGATWDLYVTSDNSYMAFVREGNAASGSVDLFTLLKDLEGRGLLSSSDILWQVNFGLRSARPAAGRPASPLRTTRSAAHRPARRRGQVGVRIPNLALIVSMGLSRARPILAHERGRAGRVGGYRSG